MYTTEQKKAIVEIINNNLNLPFIGEKMEQILIFSPAVNLIDHKLDEIVPPEWKEIIQDINQGLDPRSSEFVDDLVNNIVDKLVSEINIPFISKKYEEVIIRSALKPLLDSLRKGKKL